MSEDLKRAFGAHLQQLHVAKGWNQSDLANEAGIGRDAVSTYIRGIAFPSPKNFRKLADALGITEDELMPEGYRRGPGRVDPQPAGDIFEARHELGRLVARIDVEATFADAAMFMRAMTDLKAGGVPAWLN